MREYGPEDFDLPEEVPGENIFACRFTIDKLCRGNPCYEEWERTDKHGTLQVLYYDEVREKPRGLLKKLVKEHHIVRRALHHEGYCNLQRRNVWSVVKQMEADDWLEEDAVKSRGSFIFKKLENEKDADEE